MIIGSISPYKGAYGDMFAQTGAPSNSLIKKWNELQNKKSETSDEAAEKVKEEFDLLSRFCKTSGAVNKLNLSPTVKLSVMHAKGEPEIGIPEKYIVSTIITVKIKNPQTGQIKTKEMVESFTTYEYYPPTENEPDARIVKIYAKESYKRDSKGIYLIDPKTGALIPDKDPDTGLQKVTTSTKTIEIRNDKAFEVTEEEDEDAILEKHMEEQNIPEEAKAGVRRKSKQVRKNLKKATLDLAKLKKDFYVRYMGYSMRKSMAEKMKKVRQTVQGLSTAGVKYDIRVTCTNGGRHLAWQHRQGYAVDYVIYKTTNKGMTYLNKRYHASELRKAIADVKAIKDTNLYTKDEYFGTSPLKRGDHLHSHIKNPYAKATAKYTTAGVPGAKVMEKITDADINMAEDLMNGYEPEAQIPEENR